MDVCRNSKQIVCNITAIVLTYYSLCLFDKVHKRHPVRQKAVDMDLRTRLVSSYGAVSALCWVAGNCILLLDILFCNIIAVLVYIGKQVEDTINTSLIRGLHGMVC